MRAKLLLFAGVAMWISALTLTSSANTDERRDEDRRVSDAARIEQGFDIAPVHLDLNGKDRALVGLGSYLVNAVGLCVDCHTNPTYAHGGDPFQGQPKQINVTHYLAGGGVFGPFISRNLTPEDGLPEGHTFSEFKQILRHGTDFDQAHPQFGPLLQVMPWPLFQDMTDHDIRAIYEYLRAIPPALPCADVGPAVTDLTCRP
jgi:hypothetical protein